MIGEPWKTVRSRLLLDRKPWLRIFAEDVQLPDGRIIRDYLRLETPDYVVVVPVDEQDRMGLIRSYKRGVGGEDLQPPAGLIEPDETPLEAARRELLEETGCRAMSWHPLGGYVLAGNLRGGIAHLFLALACERVVKPDSGDLEAQEVLWLPVESVRDRWRSTGFRQLGSAAALGLALDRLEQQPPDPASQNRS